LVPYLSLLDNLARKLGAETRPIEVAGRTAAYLKVTGLLRKLGVLEMLGIGPGPQPGELPTWSRLAVTSLDPGISLVFAPIDDEWFLVANTPQAAHRYFEFYSKRPKLSGAEEARETISVLGKDAAFILFRRGKSVLAAYNTLLGAVNLLAPHLRPLLDKFQVDPASLPPAEEFLDDFREGFLAFTSSPTYLRVRGHRALTDLAAEASPLLLGASFAVLGLRSSREVVRPLEATAQAGPDTAPAPANPAEARLKKLYEKMVKYSKTAGKRAFPYDPQGSLAAFQRLVDAVRDVEPQDLVHPLSTTRPALRSGAGKLKLKEANVDYELAPWKQGARDNPSRILCYEKKAFDRGGRYVLFVDGSVKFFPEAQFKTIWNQQKARYSKRTN
jgi:hypothetical protein